MALFRHVHFQLNILAHSLETQLSEHETPLRQLNRIFTLFTMFHIKVVFLRVSRGNNRRQ